MNDRKLIYSNNLSVHSFPFQRIIQIQEEVWIQVCKNISNLLSLIMLIKLRVSIKVNRQKLKQCAIQRRQRVETNILVHIQPSQSTFRLKLWDFNQIREKIWHPSLKVLIVFGQNFKRAPIFTSKKIIALKASFEFSFSDIDWKEVSVSLIFSWIKIFIVFSNVRFLQI